MPPAAAGTECGRERLWRRVVAPQSAVTSVVTRLLPSRANCSADGCEQDACVRHLFASLEQDALNKLRKDRNDLDLHVPLLSGYPRMHRHVLYRELNFDRQTPQFHNLG